MKQEKNWVFFCKGLFRISAKVHTEVDKIKCLNKGINSYDKYIKRSVNLQIKNLKGIQQKIAVANAEKRNAFQRSVHEEMNDRFDIIKRLSEFLSVRSIDDLLEPENVKLRIVEVSPFVGQL